MPKPGYMVKQPLVSRLDMTCSYECKLLLCRLSHFEDIDMFLALLIPLNTLALKPRVLKAISYTVIGPSQAARGSQPKLTGAFSYQL